MQARTRRPWADSQLRAVQHLAGHQGYLMTLSAGGLRLSWRSYGVFGEFGLLGQFSAEFPVPVLKHSKSGFSTWQHGHRKLPKIFRLAGERSEVVQSSARNATQPHSPVSVPVLSGLQHLRSVLTRKPTTPGSGGAGDIVGVQKPKTLALRHLKTLHYELKKL